MLVIHPDECIDCGVCEPECPPAAIVPGLRRQGREVAQAERRLLGEVAQHHPQGYPAPGRRRVERRAGQVREVLFAGTRQGRIDPLRHSHEKRPGSLRCSPPLGRARASMAAASCRASPPPPTSSASWARRPRSARWPARPGTTTRASRTGGRRTSRACPRRPPGRGRAAPERRNARQDHPEHHPGRAGARPPRPALAGGALRAPGAQHLDLGGVPLGRTSACRRSSTCRCRPTAWCARC